MNRAPKATRPRTEGPDPLTGVLSALSTALTAAVINAPGPASVIALAIALAAVAWTTTHR